MVTIIRDRVQDMVKKGMTLEQVKAAQADARLRPALRRDDRLLDDRHVRRGRLQEPEAEVNGRERHAATFCGNCSDGGASHRTSRAAPWPWPRACRAAAGQARAAGAAKTPRAGRADRSHRLLGVDRHRRLALPDGDAAQGRLPERPAQRRGHARSPTRGIRRRTKPRATRARRTARRTSCACPGASTSPGRTTRR